MADLPLKKLVAPVVILDDNGLAVAMCDPFGAPGVAAPTLRLRGGLMSTSFTSVTTGPPPRAGYPWWRAGDDA